MSEIAFSPRARVAALLALVAISLFVLSRTLPLVRPFLWACVAAYVLNPLVTLLASRTRLARGWMVAWFYLLGFVIVGWAAAALRPTLLRELHELGRALPGMVRDLQQTLLGSEKLEILGFTVTSDQIAESLVGAVRDLGGWASGHALVLAIGLFGVVVDVLLFLVTTFFLLVDAERIGRAAEDLIPPPYRPEILELGRQVNGVLNVYVRGLLFLVALMTLVTGVALSLLQVRFALVLALLTGLLELIPIVGPITAGVLAVLVAVSQPNVFGWNPMLFGALIAGIYTVLRHAEDYLVIPNVIGRIVGVHPLIMLFGVLAGGLMAGVTGLFLAAPTIAVLRLVMPWLYRKLI